MTEGPPSGLTELDHIGVERALREELDIAELVRLFVEDIDEGGADRLALLFGVGDAGELVEKEAARVAMDQRDVVVAAKEAHHLVGLAGPQQAGIDKDAGQLIADRFVQQYCCHRGIDAARKATHDLAVLDLPANFVHRLRSELCHRPVTAAAGDPMGEVAQQLGALRCVHDLGMEQHAVKPAAVVGDRGIGRRFARRHRAEAGRQSVDPVAVAHPHLLAPAPRP